MSISSSIAKRNTTTGSSTVLALVLIQTVLVFHYYWSTFVQGWQKPKFSKSRLGFWFFQEKPKFRFLVFAHRIVHAVAQ
jgi:hypothetical protein